MKQPFFIALFFLSFSANAQELFAVTEPASTRPAGSIGFRFDHLVMNEINSSKINYHLIPGDNDWRVEEANGNGKRLFE